MPLTMSPIQQQPSAGAPPSVTVARLLDAFPCDLLIGIELGVARGLAAAPVSRLLMETGGYSQRGNQRHAAVLGAVFAVMRQGLDHPESQAYFQRIREVHGRLEVPDDYVLYAIAGIVTGIIDWTDRFAWRGLTHEERAALGAYWSDFAQRIDLANPPADADEWTAYLQRQEAVWHRYSSDNEQLAEVMQDLFARRVPRIARPAARLTFKTMIGRDLLPHIGWKPPHPLLRGLVVGTVYCRGRLGKVFPAMRRSGRVFLENLGCPALRY